MSSTTVPRPGDAHTLRTLAELVRDAPGRARVLERHGLDYCCHGDRTLAAAAAEAGLVAEDVAVELDAVEGRHEDPVADLSVAELLDHIVEVHHRYLDEELPALDALAAKVATVHGAHHPELGGVADLVAAVRADVEPHLADEETEVFPAIRRQVESGEPAPAEMVERLRDDHETLGALLAELRRQSGDYAVPEDGCASYRSLYERLAALERDTFRHIHLENNVLFPAVAGRGGDVTG